MPKRGTDNRDIFDLMQHFYIEKDIHCQAVMDYVFEPADFLKTFQRKNQRSQKYIQFIADGIKLAEEIIDSGKAMETLEMLIELSNS